MPIDDKDFMHGAALVRIADNDQFTALNKASLKYGHYVVNHDRHLFIKYSNRAGPEYHFTFNHTDVQRMVECRDRGKVYAIFVCHEETIAALSLDELQDLIDFTHRAAQWLRVVAHAGRSLRFHGPRGQLGPLARNAFPRRVLE